MNKVYIIGGIGLLVMGLAQLIQVSREKDLPIAKRKEMQNTGIMFVFGGVFIIGWILTTHFLRL
jgi:hypothetical protein